MGLTALNKPKEFISFLVRTSYCASSIFTPEVSSIVQTPMQEEEAAAGASECKELTPIEHLDIEKMLNDAWPKDKTLEQPETEQIAGEGIDDDGELDKQLELFNQINEENYDENILFKSRRLKVIEAKSPSTELKGIVEIAQLARADTEEEKTEITEESPGDTEVNLADDLPVSSTMDNVETASDFIK